MLAPIAIESAIHNPRQALTMRWRFDRLKALSSLKGERTPKAFASRLADCYALAF
jgi:hypothetical protein